MDMKEIIYTGLQTLSQKHTLETLGDRKNYLGASDIGYCPRKVIYDRIAPPKHDLNTLIRFQRGHMAEDIIANAMTAAGYGNFERQVELDISTDQVPFLVHIDFVFTNSKQKTKAILEVKSGTIPDSPYGSWESQLHVQMGAMKRQFPDYHVKGAIISMDLSSGEIGFFNGYLPCRKLFHFLIGRAEHTWQNYRLVQAGDSADVRTEIGPLCSFCDHLSDCPRFQGDELPDMAEQVIALKAMMDEEKRHKEKVKNHKNIYLKMVNTRGPFKAGGYLLREAKRSRSSTDFERLNAFLSEYGTNLSDFQVSNSFSFLEIKKTN